MPTTRTVSGRVETTVSVSRVRETARCKRCKGAHSRLYTRTSTTDRSVDTGKVLSRFSRDVREAGAAPRWSCCGREWSYLDVQGTVRRDKPCDARCQASKGHTCECACGGLNHGASHG